MKDSQVRIIYAGFYPEPGRRLLCAVRLAKPQLGFRNMHILLHFSDNILCILTC